jgi:hypothetical protein
MNGFTAPAGRPSLRSCVARGRGAAELAIALVVAFVCVGPTASAQSTAAAHIAASRLFGGHWDDTVEQLVRGPDGKLYAYGLQASPFASGVSSSAFTNAGQASSYVARIDPSTLAVDWVAPVGRDRSASAPPDDADRVDGFALGADGNLYVAAYAASTRYPLDGGTYTGWGGAKYVYRVDALGNVAVHAGPLDPAIRSIRALAADAAGNVWFAGRAGRALATSAGAMVTGAQLGTQDGGAYLMKIDRVTRAPVVSTFLTVPGSRSATPDTQWCRDVFRDAETTPYAIALAADGSVYVAGQANPGDMPATPGAATTPDVAFRDAFVMRVNATGTAGLFVARFGGADNDRATSLVVEPDGNVLVAGKWLDKGGIWHGPRGGFQTSITRQWVWTNTCEATVPTEAAFLLRVAPDGSQLGGASMIGAVGGDLAGWMGHDGVMPVRIAPDGAGHVLIVGTTDSGQSLPTSRPFVPDAALYQYAVKPTHAFVMKVRTADFSLVHASRLGPRDSHAEGRGVAVDGAGNVFVAGRAPNAEAFPMVNVPVGGRPSRYAAAFVTRVHETPLDLALNVAPAQPLAGTPVQLTATLGDRNQAASIDFRNRGTLVGSAPLVGGVAQLSIALPAGIHQLSATVRGGGVWHGDGTAPTTLVVTQTSASQ